MSKLISKIFRAFLLFVVPAAFVAIIVISYFTLSKLVFPSDLLLRDGTKLSEFAKQIRSELVKRKDLRIVHFKTKDGINLSGYLVKRKNPKANLLVCHGYQTCKERLYQTLDMFTDYNILLFDFRTHGQSDGKYRTLGCHEYKDVIAAAEFLQASTKQQKPVFARLPLVILGFSMGGATSVYAVENDPTICDALILDSSFANLEDVIYHAFKSKSGLPSFPFVPVIIKMVNFLASCQINKMSPLNSIKSIKQPVFFIHSCTDKIVKPSDSLLMYSNATNPKSKLWIFPQCEHGNLIRKQCKIYKNKVEKFIKKVI